MLTPEGIARQIKTIYEDDYATSLSTVETSWQETQHIELHDFADRRIVADPDNMGVFRQFPALAIGIGELREDEGSDQRMQQFVDYYRLEVRLVYFLKGIDQTELSLRILRHMEATLDFMKEHPGFGYSRDVTVRSVMMEPSANTLNTGGNTLVKGLGFRFQLRFLQSGA